MSDGGFTSIAKEEDASEFIDHRQISIYDPERGAGGGETKKSYKHNDMMDTTIELFKEMTKNVKDFRDKKLKDYNIFQFEHCDKHVKEYSFRVCKCKKGSKITVKDVTAANLTDADKILLIKCNSNEISKNSSSNVDSTGVENIYDLLTKKKGGRKTKKKKKKKKKKKTKKKSRNKRKRKKR